MFKKYTVVAWMLPLSFLLSAAMGGEIIPAEAVIAELPPPAPICPEMVGAPTLVADVVLALQQSPKAEGHWQNPRKIAALITQIDGLTADGLNPRHYRLSELQQARAALAKGETLTECASAGINRAYVTALRDLYFGRVNPEKAQLFWYAEQTPRKVSAEDLTAIALRGMKKSMASAFKKARPTLPLYDQLRNAYQTALATYPQSWTKVPSGPPLLRVGDEEFRVPLLKRRLREGGYLAPLAEGAQDDAVVSGEMALALKAFQTHHSLKIDGVVGPQTIAEMNIQPAERLAQFKVNLERLRWYARDKEDSMLLVDIAGAEVNYLRQGVVAMAARAQAGQPKRETPALKSQISHITFNPTWTVPPTILRNDVLPEVRKDIGYLAKKHIRVFDGEGNELNPYQIDWGNPGKVRLRQDSGPEAALGKVAIRFPNPFAVYLHDTPNQKLFATSGRFYSSGCVRVENAVSLTDLLFDNAPDDIQARIGQARETGKTKNISLPTAIPLLMVYWTAIANDKGEASFRPDVYQQDQPLLRLLTR